MAHLHIDKNSLKKFDTLYMKLWFDVWKTVSHTLRQHVNIHYNTMRLFWVKIVGVLAQTANPRIYRRVAYSLVVFSALFSDHNVYRSVDILLSLLL